MAIEKQELHCHNCDRYVQFDIDPDMDGNFVIKCPNCGHEHCRVVKNGMILDDNVVTYLVSTSSTYSYFDYITTDNSTAAYSADIDVFYRQLWANTTCSTNY